ncbi:hypothetical protein RGC63_07150, partial [Helicobacter pylori]
HALGQRFDPAILHHCFLLKFFLFISRVLVEKSQTIGSSLFNAANLLTQSSLMEDWVGLRFFVCFVL